jgi:Uma2 family endonuclease
MTALSKLAPSRMTIEEFLDWPGDGSTQKFELVDGEPRAMAPESVPHGIIQANTAGVLRSRLIGSRCYVVVEPGVIPRVRSDANMRVPDLAVSCEVPGGGQRALTEPTLVVEILSPSNESETRENVWAYTTIPTILEILLIRSTRIAAELIRRGADGSWPSNPQPIDSDSVLVLESIDFSCPLAAICDNTHLSRTVGGG